MKLTKLLLLTLAGVFSSGAAAQATGIGYDPLGGAGQASWDYFTAGIQFTGFSAPDSIGFTSITLSQSTLGTFPYGPQAGGGGDNDVFYTFFGPSTGWTLDGEAGFEITELRLQVKLFAASRAVAEAYYAPLLSFGSESDLTATGISVRETGETFNASPAFVISYVWSDLNIDENTAFTFNLFHGGANHEAIDGFRLDTVPEPGTWAALAVGAGVLFGARRFRRNG